MENEFMMPWAISNVVGLTLLFICWKYPRAGRFSYGFIFLLASVINSSVVLSTPEVYLQYGELTISPLYKAFIEGFFSAHTELVVLLIAIGQLLTGLGLFFGKKLLKPAFVGGIIFSIAITPLGIGSGFPLPLLMALSLFVLYKSDHLPAESTIIT